MNAVIYSRVSSKEQIDGTSLQSQELACRDYARRHNVAVIKVFVEQGESAKFADRTQLLELLTYCKDKKKQIEILLVWKIDRFARNVEDHYTIKAALKKLGVRIVSVTEPIQADPNGKLMETILAGFAQFDNDIRALRTVQGMQQRIREGIWPWKPPLGYFPPKVGKKTVPDEPDPRSFELLRKAWQLFATGAYTKAEILRLLQNWGLLAYRGRLATAQLLDHMFQNPYYAGVVRDPWTGSEYPGRHVAMVTATEFARVQEIIGKRQNSRPHHRVTEAFPLRGRVRCPTCRCPMTGYFARGRRQRYPYYKCWQRACATRNRSYSANGVHREFAKFLTDTSVPHYLAVSIITGVISTYWEDTAQVQEAAAANQREVGRLKRQLQEIIAMRASRLISDDEFLAQRQDIRSTLAEIQASRLNDADASLSEPEIDTAGSILADLEAAWWALPLEAKRGFCTLLFPAGYEFQRVRTAEIGLLFRTIEASKGDASDVVALVKQNLNTLIADIRRLLALCRPALVTEKKAA